MRYDLLNSIIHDLQGTCQSLEEVCIDHGIEEDTLTIPELAYIESEIRFCEGCGWWCTVAEMRTDILCEDCYEEE